jgi:choline kinase
LRGLVIAAGRGKRLSHISDLKPLVMVGNTPLLERILLQASKSGIDDFVVVTGYRASEMKEFLEKLSVRRNLKIDTVYNDDWQKENGLSVLKAKEHFEGQFVLMMSDHIFDASIIEKINEFPLNENEIVLAVDCNIDKNSLIDLEDVTRVKKEYDRIIDIGKNLKDYNAFDTGIFRCSPAIFSALEKSIECGDSTLSGGIRTLAIERKARVMDIGDSFWIDVDDENALQKACRLCEEVGEASLPEELHVYRYEK